MIAALLRMFMSESDVTLLGMSMIFLYIINNIKFQVGKAKFQVSEAQAPFQVSRPKVVSSFKTYAFLGGYLCDEFA